METIKQKMANDLIGEALELGRDRQHTDTATYGEAACTEEAPCIFCQAIAVRERATPEQIAAARREYEDNECEIDDDALQSRAEEESGSWVSAWVWIYDEETDEQGDNDNDE